jgi:hypothetical protein
MRYDIATGVKRAKTKVQKFVMGSAALAFPAAIALSSGTAAAVAGYTLFGDAEIVSPGNASPHAAQIRSLDGGGFGGVRFTSSSVSTLNDLTNLATDTYYSENSCGGGSPRFQVRVTNGVNTGNIFVYLGPAPAYTGCPMNVWIPGTNLVTPASLVDTSQLPGGTFYDPYASAQAKYGGYSVIGLSVVADGEWAFPSGNQTVLVDNVQINSDTVTFDQPQNKDECKNDGWMTLTRADGSGFKNQGDCIQYVNTGK